MIDAAPQIVIHVHGLHIRILAVFKNEGVEGFKKVINALEPLNKKATGHRGYAYHAKNIGNKILEKYPEIKKATEEILEITNNFPNIKKQNLYNRVLPIIDRLGETVDITL